MDIQVAAIEDAEPILALQKEAYLSEAKIYDDYTIDPLTQTLEDLRAEFDQQVFLKVLVGGRIVGSVRAREDQGTCYIGRLIVHPKFQNRGIGKELMARIEEHFDQVERYELFTGHLSERNLYLYRKLGYRTFRTQEVSDNLVLVFLEKPRTPA